MWFHWQRRIEGVWLPANRLPAAKWAILELPHLKNLEIAASNCSTTTRGTSTADMPLNIVQLKQLLARERPDVIVTTHGHSCDAG